MTALVCHEPAFVPRAPVASQIWYVPPPVAPTAVPSHREFHEVWEDNLDTEFNALLAAVSRAGGPEAILALDMEFPGFFCKAPRFSERAAHYQALRCNVDQLWPIQLGVAVVGANGVCRGIWTFNLHFDADVDNHTEESLRFLRDAGMDFPRHSTEGINVLELGRRLGNSSLVGSHGHAPTWLTFSGSYDWAYLVKLLTLGRALPGLPNSFDQLLSAYCPKRQDLRDLLPTGSLEVLGQRHGVKRWGSAHTAGSDALLTLELFILVARPDMALNAAGKLGEEQNQSQWDESSWQDSSSESSWQESSSEWYPGNDQWYPGDMHGINGTGVRVASDGWENSNWGSRSQANNEWFASSAMPAKTQVWYPCGFQTWQHAI